MRNARKIILASASPRREEIFRKTGLKFEVDESNCDEKADPGLKPRELAKFLSRAKAKDVARRHRNALVIAAEKLSSVTDRNKLREVVSNLVDNAIKYNKQNGEIRISVEKTGDAAQIVIEDTGVGIAEEHLPRIFERFYRVDKERSREAGGTGLGLAIVKHIIEAHGSKVDVQSGAGAGSRFSFILKA